MKKLSINDIKQKTNQLDKYQIQQIKGGNGNNTINQNNSIISGDVGAL